MAQCFLTHELTSLLKHAIANQVNDGSLYHTCMKVNTNRLKRFEKLMMIVRENGQLHRWEDMVKDLSNNREHLFEKSLCKIMDHMFEHAFDRHHLFSLYTLIVDIAGFKLKNHHPIDINRILNVLHACIIEKKGIMIFYRVMEIL